MRLRITLALLEFIAFIIGMTAFAEWLHLPDSMPLWQTVGWIFAFLGITLASAAVMLATVLLGS